MKQMKRARKNWGKTREQCPLKGDNGHSDPANEENPEVCLCGARTEDDANAISFTPINGHVEIVTMHESLKIATDCPLYQVSWERRGSGKGAWHFCRWK